MWNNQSSACGRSKQFDFAHRGAPDTASGHGWSLLQPLSARVAVCRSYGAKTVFTFSMLQTCRPDGAIVLILIHVPKLLSPLQGEKCFSFIICYQPFAPMGQSGFSFP